MSLKNEIIRKAEYLTAETLDVLNGGHFSTYHINVSELQLRRRGKDIASTFNSMADINVALKLAFTDMYNVAAIEKALSRAKEGDRDEVPFFGDYNLGKALVRTGNGCKMVSCSCGNVVIEYKDSDYRNKTTGMPFEVITITLEPDED